MKCQVEKNERRNSAHFSCCLVRLSVKTNMQMNAKLVYSTILINVVDLQSFVWTQLQTTLRKLNTNTVWIQFLSPPPAVNTPTSRRTDGLQRAVSQGGVHLQPHANAGEEWRDTGPAGRQGRQGGALQAWEGQLHGGCEGQRSAAGPAGASEAPLLQLQGLALQRPHRGESTRKWGSSRSVCVSHRVHVSTGQPAHYIWFLSVSGKCFSCCYGLPTLCCGCCKWPSWPVVKRVDSDDKGSVRGWLSVLLPRASLQP